MFGVEECKQVFIELPANMEKEVDKAQNEFMSFVQKSAKLRAPRFSGQLAESITKAQLRIGKWQLTVESPYGFFQEYGWNARVLSQNTNSRSGYLVGDWMSAHGFSGTGVKPRGIAHPFISLALDSGLNHLPTLLQKAAYKAALGRKK